MILKYSRLLETRRGLFTDEAELPYPRERIRQALKVAMKDPVYLLAPEALRIASRSLDTFVPGDRVRSTQALFDLVCEFGTATDGGWPRPCSMARQKSNDVPYWRSSVKRLSSGLARLGDSDQSDYSDQGRPGRDNDVV